MQDTEFTPFGKLSRDEKIALFVAWVDGAKIEYRYSGHSWLHVSVPAWDLRTQYRIAPTKPSIDWSHVAPKWKFMAVDLGGLAFLYDRRPQILTDNWSSNTSPQGADVFASFTPGTCDWRDSLVERPEGV